MRNTSEGSEFRYEIELKWDVSPSKIFLAISFYCRRKNPTKNENLNSVHRLAIIIFKYFLKFMRIQKAPNILIYYFHDLHMSKLQRKYKQTEKSDLFLFKYKR